MRTCLILDTETSGLNPADGAEVIEVAVQLYDIVNACPITSYARLIKPKGPIGDEGIHGISPMALECWGGDSEEVWSRITILAQKADCVVAHNAEFDRQFCPKFEYPNGLDREEYVAQGIIGANNEIPWLCTMNDFAWPRKLQSKSLVSLALSLGLGVASAHRAMADVDTISRVFTRCAEMGCNLEEMFAHAARPKKRFIALVSYDQRDLAKQAGFAWDGDRKQWWRKMPPEDAAELSFRTREVE